MVVFHVEAHPDFPWYEQCITFNIFPSFTHELTYSVFGMVTMYFFPLIVIIYTYTSILAEMYRRSKDSATGIIFWNYTLLEIDGSERMIFHQSNSSKLFHIIM